jgi:hypothetical protein
MTTSTTSLLDVLAHPLPCACQCHATLSVDQRSRAIASLYRFDDVMRGWGYEPIYDLAAHGLYRQAQLRNDLTYRGIAVRDDPCIYRRLLGFASHEILHALMGDVTKANYGIPFGLPYGVPLDLPYGQEAEFLDPFNRGEARAWLFATPFATALWGIEWEVRTARDVGTYGFVGGNAIVQVPEGFRAVPHWDRVHHGARYYALARRLEQQEREWLTEERSAELVGRVLEAEALGAKKRARPWPAAESFARLAPRLPGRNDACLCGSGKKFKKCCGVAA